MARIRSKGARPRSEFLTGLAVSRDEEILRAAFDVFTDKGFHAATMLEVATRANASKTTIYSRFANKETLFQKLVEWDTRQGIEALNLIAEDRMMDPRTALNRFATRLLIQMMRPEKLALYRIAVAEGARMPHIGRILSYHTRDHGSKLGHIISQRLVDHGVIKISDPEEYGHSFIGLLQGELFTRALVGAIPPPSPRMIELHAKRAMNRLIRAFSP